MHNPFIFGEIMGAERLVDRKTELQTVEQTLQTGAKLFLIGPRRYGKSSILRAARENLPARGIMVLLFNVEAYSDLDSLARAIIAASAKATQGPLQAVGEKIRTVFSRLRPELSYDIASGSWSATLGLGDSGGKDAGNLIEALNGLEALAQADNRPMGLALDEFQRVIELGGVEAEAQIRAAIQNHSRIGYVFAGSKTRLLTDMVSNAERPFYRLGSALFLKEIPREDFRDFLRTAFTGSNMNIGAEAIEAILDSAADVPYNVQLLAHTTWNTALENRQITVATVHTALESLIAQQDPFYSQLWLWLTPIQGRVLQWLLHTGGTNLLGTEATRKIGKNPATIQRSLAALQDKDIIRLETRAGTAAYRLEDPFFGAWVQRTIAPL
jgi:hypothetical protein